MAKVTSGQIRAARAFLDWSWLDLAKAGGVSIATVKRLEDGSPCSPDDALDRVQGALETEGVRFLSDGADGLGISVKRP